MSPIAFALLSSSISAVLGLGVMLLWERWEMRREQRRKAAGH
ncbi:MAG TPA: hypothetical protein VEO74_03735 [Thermoanaerobaculia bacterium]|nr:hypothetical protein [Thermoanaerobaculia bacterium]